MIKYYCDRCGREMTEYSYECDSALITIQPKLIEDRKEYRLCGTCESGFNRFIKGDEVKRVVQIKD